MNKKPIIRRSTPRRVKVVEAIAELAIRAGGVGTIFAVTLMMGFLFSVAWPLFRGPQVLEQTASAYQAPSKVVHMGLDEGANLVWLLEENGLLRGLKLQTGQPFFERQVFEGAAVESISPPLVGETFTVGFADGSIRKADFGFHTESILEGTYPEDQAALAAGESRLVGEEFFERTAEGQLRRTIFKWKLYDSIETPSVGGVAGVDRVEASTGEFFGLLDGAGRVRVLRVRESENMMTGEVDRESVLADLGPVLSRQDQNPRQVLLATGATKVYVVYADGTLDQISLLRFSKPELVSSTGVLDAGRSLDRIAFMPGRSSLLVSDSKGQLASWFGVRPRGGGEAVLTKIQTYEDGAAPLQALSFSLRSRMFLTGRAGGVVQAWQGTLGDAVEDFSVPNGETIQQLAFHPRQDGVVALTDRGFHHWRVNFGYPEASLQAMFTPVWYEGYQEPDHVWQSSSSSDDFEPKIGMWPLVFGTIKATIFALLFGAPIAILGALFTSEYMHSRRRAATKTLVELLAGLPSVVLGFLAALVVAPFVQAHLSRVLSVFFLLPLVLLTGAFVWQLWPTPQRRRFSGGLRQLVIFLCPLLAVGLAWWAGPLVEWTLFGGDSQAWLDHQHGGAAPGWFFLMLPLAAVCVILTFSLKRDLRASPQKSMLRFVLGIVCTTAIAAGLAFLLQALGWDPRGGIMDTYEQRNALVVGIAVGLVVLPIVYTLTEDALGEVPQNLREASLGTGATHWQTAVRVVLPFATSGIFSALMVGLGRAVGETMIVLMAAGNTPLTEWNVFNGFRTLAANIATEIPEAVVGSAHYRALFFTALILFGMTFVINTLAELVRRHFRAKVRSL